MVVWLRFAYIVTGIRLELLKQKGPAETNPRAIIFTLICLVTKFAQEFDAHNFKLLPVVATIGKFFLCYL